MPAESARTGYLPIAEHGLIGDLHTVALVGTDGTIDWYCCPRFDSPSVFAALLDADRGGRFRVAPDRDGWVSKQLYLPDTAVLITRFLTSGGVAEVQDFMPPQGGTLSHRQRLIRRIVAVRGRARFFADVAPLRPAQRPRRRRGRLPGLRHDAANMLFHVVNERHRRRRSMLFTTNKPLSAWGQVLHDDDLAQAIPRSRPRARPPPPP
jgi:hypothetical protein